MDELPHRAIIHFQVAFGQFGNKAAQCKVSPLTALKQPIAVFTPDRSGLVTTHLARRNAAGIVKTVNPANRRADRYTKTPGRRTTRHSLLQNRTNNTLT